MVQQLMTVIRLLHNTVVELKAANRNLEHLKTQNDEIIANLMLNNLENENGV